MNSARCDCHLTLQLAIICQSLTDNLSVKNNGLGELEVNKEGELLMDVAIMSAMHEENASIVKEMDVDKKEVVGSRTYYSGKLMGRSVVVVFSHWGKVAAAITAATLINKFDVKEIIFTGVAGAIDSRLSTGDIVIGTDMYQHDMDASPIIRRHEIPLLGRAAIAADESIRLRLVQAAEDFINKDFSCMVAPEAIKAFNLNSPKVYSSAIASGDQFVANPALADDIRQRLPGVACVEMEGAAVAQVCESYGVAFGVIRTLSDNANESSEIDFQAFITDVARDYSLGIVKRYLQC